MNTFNLSTTHYLLFKEILMPSAKICGLTLRSMTQSSGMLAFVQDVFSQQLIQTLEN